VISKISGQILHLARHKFASNVIEKALVSADMNSRRMLIDEIMTAKSDGTSPVVTMMKDQYASNFHFHPPALYLFVNLVLQTMFFSVLLP
jgi:hypothetical protein